VVLQELEISFRQGGNPFVALEKRSGEVEAEVEAWQGEAECAAHAVLRELSSFKKEVAELQAELELIAECEAVQKPKATVAEARSIVGSKAGGLARIPHRLLIEVLLHLEPQDAACMSLCGQFFLHAGDDGVLWKNLFSQWYPSSELTAESIADWKHCFLLEVNHIEADLICFHTKVSFREAVLGVPVDFSVNPRTNRIDYISTTLDYVSLDAFKSGLRLSQWNEAFKDWLPLFLTPEHFQRARPSFEKSVVRLSPHWRTSRFNSVMVLEVIPKLMNTMVVLLCDKGVEACDRALDGYFLLWRLLQASVSEYGLQDEVYKRLLAFRDPANRTKDKVPSVGDWLPLLAVAGDKSRNILDTLAQPILEETFDRNVLWACRDNPQFAKPEQNVLKQGADMARLQATFTSTKVSKRLLMFHVHFLKLVKEQTLDLFFGRPSQNMRGSFKKSVKSILEIETWPAFFAACGRPCPGPAALTDIIKRATKNSKQKAYHSDRTDFSRIQASGVSHILKKRRDVQSWQLNPENTPRARF
jgi:hypothetical protein